MAGPWIVKSGIFNASCEMKERSEIQDTLRPFLARKAVLKTTIRIFLSQII